MEADFIQRLLTSPRFIFVFGVIELVGGGAGLVFAYWHLKRFPSAPEPMTLAAAIERVDRGQEPWVKVSTPYLGCSRSFMKEGTVYVPIGVDPLVLAEFDRPKYFDCSHVDRGGIVGVIDRAPPRNAQYVFGDSSRVFYRLSTWSGPDNDRIGIKLCLIFIGSGLLMFVLARYQKRRRARP